MFARTLYNTASQVTVHLAAAGMTMYDTQSDAEIHYARHGQLPQSREEPQ